MDLGFLKSWVPCVFESEREIFQLIYFFLGERMRILRALRFGLQYRISYKVLYNKLNSLIFIYIYRERERWREGDMCERFPCLRCLLAVLLFLNVLYYYCFALFSILISTDMTLTFLNLLQLSHHCQWPLALLLVLVI
jgi:hypothetical protein